HSGEVVVRSIGSALHMDYPAVAKPGSALITAASLKLAEGYIPEPSRSGPPLPCPDWGLGQDSHHPHPDLTAHETPAAMVPPIVMIGLSVMIALMAVIIITFVTADQAPRKLSSRVRQSAPEICELPS